VTLLDVSSRQEDGRVWLTLQGELDLATIADADAVLAELEGESGAMPMVIDLRALRFMDSTGLRFLLGADARARERGGRLVVVRGPDAVDRIFRLGLLDGRLTLVDHPDQDPGERETTDA
jgi:anti-sigma B factor antagonist